MIDPFKLPSFTEEVAELLRAEGGPPELAAELVTIAQQHCLTSELKQWIMFHKEWTAPLFLAWCLKYQDFVNQLAQLQRDIDKWRRPE